MLEVAFYGDARFRLKPDQHVVSFCFDESCNEFVLDESFRKSAAKINRLLHRECDNGLSHTTLKDRTEAFGQRIVREQSEQAGNILQLKFPTLRKVQ